MCHRAGEAVISNTVQQKKQERRKTSAIQSLTADRAIVSAAFSRSQAAFTHLERSLWQSAQQPLTEFTPTM